MDVGGQETTYEPLDGRGSGRSRSSHSTTGSGLRRPGSMDSPEFDNRAPKDQRHSVYLALLAAGIGFVLPYNRWAVHIINFIIH